MKDEIKFVSGDHTVEIHLPDGRLIAGPKGAPVGEFLQILDDESSPPIVGAIVDDSLRELRYCIEYEARVIPVTMATEDGMRIYRRSLTFLLEMAFSELFPNEQMTIDHSVSAGGYFCRVQDSNSFGQKELETLSKKMKEIVEDDLEFERVEVPLEKAIEYFTNAGKSDKVRLLKHRKKDYLVLYSYKGHRDYHHGYKVPSSGYIKWFELTLISGGFILRFPRRGTPTEITPLGDYPKLLETFHRYGNWLERLGIESVGALNDCIQDGRIQEVVLVTEALHEQRIVDMATAIEKRREEIRVVSIAGPSSSGKTTSSKRLSIQLLAYGVHPFALELDRYFVDRDKTPVDANGEYDFEHIDAIDRERLNHDLIKLIAGEEVRLPVFNFLDGKSEEGKKIHLENDQVVIIEGIHGLNPELLFDIPEEKKYRVYLSALTQLNLDRHNRVSTTDTRLLRRIVRDARDRGYTPQETIQRWESVRRGERRYIFPYQENADETFNSALVYELAALKPLAEPLLRQVPFGTPEHIEVKRLLALLEWFLPLESEYIPDNSLLREFIGGSILKDFQLWRRE